MQSCSKLFLTKLSKPKMSSTPIVSLLSLLAPPPDAAAILALNAMLIFWISQSNMVPYSACKTV